MEAISVGLVKLIVTQTNYLVYIICYRRFKYNIITTWGRVAGS